MRRGDAPMTENVIYAFIYSFYGKTSLQGTHSCQKKKSNLMAITKFCNLQCSISLFRISQFWLVEQHARDIMKLDMNV